MPEPDTSSLFPEIQPAWLRRAVIAAWLDGYRTRGFEERSAALEAAIAKSESLTKLNGA